MAAPAIDMLPTDAAETLAPNTPLKEQAWALYCQGAHSPEIGRRLGISERTVRSWLNRTLRDLDAEHTALRQHELALAIARKRQLSAAAWESYFRLSAVADAECAKAADGDPTANFRLVRQALSTGARYLALANAIDRDLVRLSDPRAHAGQPTAPTRAPMAITHTADHRDDPPDAADLLDLVTPDVLARMAADGILDDWPPSPDNNADHDLPQNENAAKTANPESASLAPAEQATVRTAHPMPPAHSPKTTQNENAAISANPGSLSSGQQDESTWAGRSAPNLRRQVSWRNAM